MDLPALVDRLSILPETPSSGAKEVYGFRVYLDDVDEGVSCLCGSAIAGEA